MTTNETGAQLKASAENLLATHPNLTPEQAEAWAKAEVQAASAKLQASAGKPSPEAEAAPAAPPVVPRIDVAALAGLSPAKRAAAWRQHERDLAAWVPIRTSWTPPVTAEALAAQERLRALRERSDFDTDQEKVNRAQLMEEHLRTLIAGGSNGR